MTNNIADLTQTFLGGMGRMISGSKTFYREAHPTHVVVFNSNVCTDRGKIWYGDIDITLTEERLKKLSLALKEKLYVLYEMDGRFENENSPRRERAVVVVDGETVSVGDVYKEYFIRDEKGTLRAVPIGQAKPKKSDKKPSKKASRKTKSGKKK